MLHQPSSQIRVLTDIEVHLQLKRRRKRTIVLTTKLATTKIKISITKLKRIRTRSQDVSHVEVRSIVQNHVPYPKRMQMQSFKNT